MLPFYYDLVIFLIHAFNIFNIMAYIGILVGIIYCAVNLRNYREYLSEHIVLLIFIFAISSVFLLISIGSYEYFTENFINPNEGWRRNRVYPFAFLIFSSFNVLLWCILSLNILRHRLIDKV